MRVGDLSLTGIRAMPSRSGGLTSSSYCNVIILSCGTVSKLGPYSFFYGQTDNSQLSTFSHRGYPLKKIQENNEAEIMKVVLEEAREGYAEEIVVALQSESTDDLESNVSRIVQWIEAWQKNQGSDSGS